MRGADRVSSFVLVVFALVAVNEARKLRLGSLSSPGPGFVPLCLAVALALVGMILLWHALREPESPALPAEPGARWKSVVSLAALVAYTFALEPVGFVLATAAPERRWTEQASAAWTTENGSPERRGGAKSDSENGSVLYPPPPSA